MRTLAWLRISAIAGQCAAVLAASRLLGLPIPELNLLVGIGFLAVFATFAAWRLVQPWPITEIETVAHIAVDTLLLGYLLYFTGGASNAFVTLLVLPIALSAAALSVPAVLAVASLSGLAYLGLLRWYVPLPPMAQGGPISDFSLHVAGTAANFLITAILLGFFINRLAQTLRLQQQEVQRVRERALRDEGILAIATQAAGAAHELNTPLATMCTLLPELRREHAGEPLLAEDLALLQGQVDRCRGILREMVAFGQAQLSQEPERVPLNGFVHSCLERFQLLRPEAELVLKIDPAISDTALRVPAGLRHALINLLNNAADASASRDSNAVELEIAGDRDWLVWIVRDHGPGFEAEGAAVSLGRTGKQTGLGLGLALAEATAERLNGELAAGNTPEGAEVRLRLPRAALSRR